MLKKIKFKKIISKNDSDAFDNPPVLHATELNTGITVNADWNMEYNPLTADMLKPGMRVKIKSWKQMEKEIGLDEDGDIYVDNFNPNCNPYFDSDMKVYCNKILTVEIVHGWYIKAKEVNCFHFPFFSIEKIIEDVSKIQTEQQKNLDWCLVFEKFLSENGCFDEFYESFKNNKQYKNLNDLCKQEKPSNYIRVAFCWSDTPQGYYYWKDIEIKWWRDIETKWSKICESYQQIDKSEIQKVFEQFLKDNNCYDNFIENLKKNDGYHGYNDKTISDICKNKHISKYDIINSFPWKLTSEGFSFWYGIHIKWARFYHGREKSKKLDEQKAINNSNSDNSNNDNFFDKFIKFLIRNNSCNMYFYNFLMQIENKKELGLAKSIYDFLSYASADRFLYAFSWINTSEGNNYWAKLNREWIREMELK